MTREPYVPVTVRYGGPRKRLAWRIKGWREDLALTLAPWFRGLARHVRDQRDCESEAAHWCGVAMRHRYDLERLVSAVEEERRWATGTRTHTAARSALYDLAEDLAQSLSEGGAPNG